MHPAAADTRRPDRGDRALLQRPAAGPSPAAGAALRSPSIPAVLALSLVLAARRMSVSA